jgi:serine/threonine protein kinase
MIFVDLAAGSEFGGRYRVVRRLASGGMGTVYEVVHLETERRRALKIMQADLFQNAALRARFRNEARVTAQVKSDHLVDVFDAGVDPATGMPFLVMELLIGEDLGRRVERLGPLPPEEVVAYLAEVGGALDKTHAASIVHRDLKPANLFLVELDDGSRRVKILDFGISKIVSEATSDATSRSLGTPAYMAPEQLLGEPVSAATDIHALGLIAYTLLVGQSYWQKDVESVDNIFAFALRAQEGPRESALGRAARQGRTLPVGFGAWFERATAREPSARFPRASAAVAALAEALGVPGSAGSVAHGVSVDKLEVPLARSALSGVRWLALPAVLAVVAGIVLLLRSPSSEPTPAPAEPREAQAVSASPPPPPVAPPAPPPVPASVASRLDPRPAASAPRTAPAPVRRVTSPPEPRPARAGGTAAPAASVSVAPPSSAALPALVPEIPRKPEPPREKAPRHTRD